MIRAVYGSNMILIMFQYPSSYGEGGLKEVREGCRGYSASERHRESHRSAQMCNGETDEAAIFLQ